MPDISPAFAVEDIHEIRAWHHARRKDMTPEEICEDTRKGAECFIKLLASPIDPAIHAVNAPHKEPESVASQPL
jgi:hypothetical protein